MKYSKKAFTLVELIIVITILAILGTIAFISLQGYSKQARDSRRISDISNIKKSLELFQLNTGKYPIPDNFSTMSYSGETMFYQGVVGDNVTQNLSANLQEKPLDPLHKIEYIYSVTNTRKEYEVLTILENTSAYKNITNNTYALNFKTKLNGNYNGIFLKTQSFIIPIPSIITSFVLPVDVKNVNNSEDSFVMDNGINIPSLGIPGIEVQTGGLDINLSATGIIDSKATDEEKYSIIKAIQDTYTGTILANVPIIENVLSKTTNEEKLNFIDVTVLLTGTPIQSTVSIPSSTFSCTGIVPESNVTTFNTSGLSADTLRQNTDSGDFCYYECNTNYSINGSNCEADTQSVICEGTIPTNATATTSTNYTQTWDGNNWIPTTIWSESQAICDYDCDTNYNWNGTSCEAIASTNPDELVVGKPVRIMRSTGNYDLAYIFITGSEPSVIMRNQLPGTYQYNSGGGLPQWTSSSSYTQFMSAVSGYDSTNLSDPRIVSGGYSPYLFETAACDSSPDPAKPFMSNLLWTESSSDWISYVSTSVAWYAVNYWKCGNTGASATTYKALRPVFTIKSSAQLSWNASSGYYEFK